MSYFRLLLCSFLIPTLSLCAMQRTKNTTPALAARTISFEHIKHLLSPDIIRQATRLKQKNCCNKMLLAGTTLKNATWIALCLAKKLKYSFRICSASNMQNVNETFCSARQSKRRTIIFIRDLATLNAEQTANLDTQFTLHDATRNRICIVGWIPENKQVQTDIQNFFGIPIKLSVLTENQRKEFLKIALTTHAPKDHTIDIDELSQKTAGWSIPDLISLVRNGLESGNNQLDEVYTVMHTAKESKKNILLEGLPIAYSTPTVTLDEIANIVPQKLFNIDIVIKKRGFHPGILLHGPPGTGKTYIAEAIAGSIGWKFIYTNGASFASTMQNGPVTILKNLIQKIEDSGQPTVLCLDECAPLLNTVEKSSGDSRGTVLSEMRTMIAHCNANTMKVPILIIATTNDFEKIDIAIKSRFNSHTYEIEKPTDEIKEQLIAQQIAKVTHDNTVKETRSVLIKQLCQYSAGIDIRDIVSAIDDAATMALVNDSKTVTDRHFLSALSDSIRVKESAKSKENSSTPHMYNSGVDVGIQAGIASLSAGIPAAAGIGLASGAGFETAKYALEETKTLQKRLRQCVHLTNSEQLKKIELAAATDEANEAINASAEIIAEATKTSQKRKESLEQDTLLLTTKHQLYEHLEKDPNITQTDLLKLMQGPLNQIKTRIGDDAYANLVDSISEYYKKYKTFKTAL